MPAQKLAAVAVNHEGKRRPAVAACPNPAEITLLAENPALYKLDRLDKSAADPKSAYFVLAVFPLLQANSAAMQG